MVKKWDKVRNHQFKINMQFNNWNNLQFQRYNWKNKKTKYHIKQEHNKSLQLIYPKNQSKTLIWRTIL
jgi:hypothetical protein